MVLNQFEADVLMATSGRPAHDEHPADDLPLGRVGLASYSYHDIVRDAVLRPSLRRGVVGPSRRFSARISLDGCATEPP